MSNLWLREKPKNKFTIPIVLCFLFVFAQSGKAQDITVTNFYYDQKDLTANQQQTTVLDQNGNKCALIRVQTTQKGFVFDVGSLGIVKTEDNHAGEIWLWVPQGIRHISIRHSQLGSLSNYDFPVAIQKARVYIMEITHGQVFVNNYDDSKQQTLSIKVTPANAKLFLNGMSVDLDSRGEASREMAYGQFTYKVEATGYYPKEGQVVVNDNEHSLNINDLKPIMGKLTAHTNQNSAVISIDGKQIKRSVFEPVELQIGKHEVSASCAGYRTETKIVEIKADETTDIAINLVQQANFQIISNPTSALVYINGECVGRTPCTRELISGTYNVAAVKHGYKDFSKRMTLDSSNPTLSLSLKRLYARPNEFYIDGSFQMGAFNGAVGTIGAFIKNINIEASYVYALNEYTCTWNHLEHYSITPTINIETKTGYGFILGKRFRITPQIGLAFHKFSNSFENGSYFELLAGESNTISGILALRTSMAFVSHFAVCIVPEYNFPIEKSKGYKALSEISSGIKDVGQGFNMKFGIAAFF